MQQDKMPRMQHDYGQGIILSMQSSIYPAMEVNDMQEMTFIYGPVPSRRLGISLGISPIPKKTCNYSCIYCQLGRTDHLTNQRQMFFPIEKILVEFDEINQRNLSYDVITIVGEGEPTLYMGLGQLILALQKKTEKPVAVITNGALLYDRELQEELRLADIVLASVDAYDEASFKKINRPHRTLTFKQVMDGLVDFSKRYNGQLLLEMMLMAGINDDNTSLEKYAALLKTFTYERLYLNTPVRPPAESDVKTINPEKMRQAVDRLGGIAIDMLHSEGFHSEITDHYAAILSIIKRHPMNQHEIIGFLKTRECDDPEAVLDDLKEDTQVDAIDYKGYVTFRLK
jgi:wyosine [tRNA(Phe)-imidazoG37] synthetase (radical SAM superfamily)